MTRSRSKLFLSALFLPLLLWAQPDTAWVRRHNGTGNSDDEARAIRVDSLGNVYVTGFAYNSGSITDFVTVKYGPTGNVLWSQVYNGPGNSEDWANALAITAKGEVYVAGFSFGSGTQRDFALVKYSAAGSERWVRRYNGPTSGDDIARAIAVDDSGFIYVTGSSGTYPNFDFATVKYDTSGNELWVRRYNGPANGDDGGMGIGCDAAGFVYVTGHSTGVSSSYDYLTLKYRRNGDTVWTRRYDGPLSSSDSALAIGVTRAGDVYVTGTSYGSGTNKDYCTLRYDTLGVLKWADRFDGGASGNDEARAIAVDAAGNCCVTGRSYTNNIQFFDFVTLKYSPTGVRVWLDKYNGTANGDDEGRAIEIDVAGNVYVTGSSYGGPTALADYLTMKYDAAGNRAFYVRYNGTGSGHDAALGIAVNPNASDTFYVTGKTLTAAPASNYDYTTIKYIYFRDVGVVRITAPAGVVDSATSVVPACSVYNYGTSSETYNVRMRIGSFYNRTVSVSAHAARTMRRVTFPAYSAWPRGSHVVTCSTELGVDMKTSNDKLTSSVTVRIPDVGVVAIAAPSGTLDSGPALVPQARVRNYGNTSVSFNVTMRIGTLYANTRTVSGLAPSDEAVVSFTAWTPVRGGHIVRCSTLLAGDLNPGNNLRRESIFVRVSDVGAFEVVSPPQVVDPGATVTPMARVENFGNVAVSFPVRMRIDTGYSDVRQVISLAPGAQELVAFANWTAANRGTFTKSCSTELGSDLKLGNDAVRGLVRVRLEDAGCTGILAPTGVVDTFVTVAPRASVRNHGEVGITFWAHFRIYDSLMTPVYADSARAENLAPGVTLALTFPDWPQPYGIGTHTARCSTALAEEQHPENDTASARFIVASLPGPPPGWSQVANVPPGVKNKRVKDGGCLACNDEDEIDMVYLLKGNNRCEFYAYNTVSNYWYTRESIPALGSAGRKKAVKRGGALAQSEGLLYATKGNNTHDFWRYTPHYSGPGYAWVQLPDVPAGTRALKEGVGLVAVTVDGTPFIYLLKGSKTLEFYRYNVPARAWETMASAPAGLSGREFRNGSCITYDPDSNRIYALKATYNEFFAYDVGGDSWRTMTPLPMTGGSSGKRKKVKDGAALAYCNRVVYALKGGNTQEFWYYSADSNSWQSGPQVPIGIGKRVKGGGSLTYALRGNCLYATKGNNTYEFWVFPLGQAASLKPHRASRTRSVTAGSNSQTSGSLEPGAWSLQLDVAPNPFSGATRITYSLPRDGNISLKLYDITGKLVSVLREGYGTAGSSSFTVHRSSLSFGIYLLRLEVESLVTTSKLIVE